MAAIATELTGSDQVIHAQPAGANTVPKLHGWSIAETGGGDAKVYLRSGASNGPVVAVVTLGADESSNVSLGCPVACPGGLYVDVDSGSVEGAVYHS